MQNKHTVMKSYTPMPTISNTVDALFTNDKFSYSISRRNTSRIIKRNSSPSIEDSLYSRQLEVQGKINQRRREQQREESEECTGRPRISRNSQHLAQKRFKSIKGDLLKHLVDQCPMAREMARYRSFPTNLVAHSPKATCNSEPPEAFHCHVQVKGGRMTSSPLELGALTTNGSISNRSSPIPFSMREVLRDQQKFSAQDGFFSAEQVKSATLFNMKSDQYYKPIPNILDLSHKDREKVLKELKDAKIKFYLDLREQEKMRNCTFSPMLGEKQLQRRCARKKRQDQQQPATYLEIHNKNKELRKKKKGNQRRKKGTNGKRSSIDLDFMHFIQHQQQIDSEFLQMFVKFTRGFCQINPYMILGVSKEANSDQIKQAYFKLAKKYHPDSQGGDAEKFKQIQDAYQKLKTGAYTETVDQEDAFYTAKAYYEQEYRRQYY